MSGLLHGGLPEVISTYGIWGMAILVMLESTGLPLPGEAALLSAAIYSGTTHRLDIVSVIAAAAVAATLGDNLGYWIGRRLGFPLLLRYGPRLGLTERKIRLGQYLFAHHGGKVVFLGRFVALLRILAAVLAGINRMTWPRFFLCNSAGAVVWAMAYGLGAYLFGNLIEQVARPIGIALLVLGIALGVAAAWVLRDRMRRFETAAGRASPSINP